MLLEIALAATLFALLLVLVPGTFLLAVLMRRQWLPSQEFSSNFVLAAALGTVWSALAFWSFTGCMRSAFRAVACGASLPSA